MSEETNPNDVLTQETTETTTQTAPADDKTVEGAPAEYEFQFGEDVEPNEELLGAVKPLFKEANLPQEKAQKLVDAYTKYEQARVASERQAWQDMQEKWVDDVKADKDVGGHDFVEKLAVAKHAVDTYGSKELKDLFNFTGVGNHVAMVKFLYNVGKTLKEDNVLTGREMSQQRDIAKLLYPTMTE